MEDEVEVEEVVEEEVVVEDEEGERRMSKMRRVGERGAR